MNLLNLLDTHRLAVCVRAPFGCRRVLLGRVPELQTMPWEGTTQSSSPGIWPQGVSYEASQAAPRQAASLASLRGSCPLLYFPL